MKIAMFFFSTAEFIKEIFLRLLYVGKKYKDLLLVLYSISLVFMSVIQSVSFLSDSLTFTTYFKIRHFDVSSFALLTHAVFGWSGRAFSDCLGFRTFFQLSKEC